MQVNWALTPRRRGSIPSSPFREKATYSVLARIDKYLGEVNWDQILRGERIPFETILQYGNLLMSQGANDIWTALQGGSITGGYYSSANASLAVADGNPSAGTGNATLTNNSTTLTLSANNTLNVNDNVSITVANGGDGNWYQIANSGNVGTNASSFTLTNPFAGVTVGPVAFQTIPAALPNASDNSFTTGSSLGGGISNVSAGANPTITTNSGHGLIPGQVVLIASVAGATGINGTWIVASVPTSTTFTVTASAPGTYSSGGTVKVVNKYRQIVSQAPTAAAVATAGGFITGVSWAGGVATITTNTAHGLTAGTPINIYGVNGSATVNGTGILVQNVPTTTTFTINIPTAPASFVSSPNSLITTGGSSTFTALFPTNAANFSWNEWSLTNSSTQNGVSAQTGGHLFNRRVGYLGVKSSQTTWTLTVYPSIG